MDMLIPMICVIVVLIGLIALIIFNVSFRKREEVHFIEPEQQAPISRDDEKSVKPVKQTRPKASTLDKAAEKDRMIRSHKTVMEDRSYRDALKKFQEKAKGEVVVRKSEEEQSLSDQAYREALRSMIKEQKKK